MSGFEPQTPGQSPVQAPTKPDAEPFAPPQTSTVPATGDQVAAPASEAPLWFGSPTRSELPQYAQQRTQSMAATATVTQELPLGVAAPTTPTTPSDPAFETASVGVGQGGVTPPASPAQAPTPPSGKPPTTRRLAELTAVALLAALLASGGTYAATRLASSDSSNPSTTTSSATSGGGNTSQPVVQANPQAPNWTDTAAAVRPSVVSISVTMAQGSAEGSGVILDTAGHILTNNHVVSGANTVTVTLNDGRAYEATIKGTDPSTDLAVVTLKSPPADLKPMAIGDSGALKVGDPVMAVGNPLGLQDTVTTGIVSALNRPVRTQSSDSQGQQQQQNPFDPFGQQQQQQQQQQATVDPVVTNAIQTSAAINPGNSGGALVNASGQLVGINSSIASLGSSGSESGNIGIGFAIPVIEAKAIADQLISTGKAEHAYIGVGTLDGTASDGSAQRSGAKIETVSPNTPAAAAGLKTGDVVIAVDGSPIDSADALIGNIRQHTVGETVKMTVLRGGSQVEVDVKLATKPATTS